MKLAGGVQCATMMIVARPVSGYLTTPRATAARDLTSTLVVRELDPGHGRQHGRVRAAEARRGNATTFTRRPR
jgi:hypothetical protein